jgi:hypothetical protein
MWRGLWFGALMFRKMRARILNAVFSGTSDKMLRNDTFVQMREEGELLGRVWRIFGKRKLESQDSASAVARMVRAMAW